MINFLSQLVSYIVVLIFLAVLFELIMPNKAFKRYVQLIFGLLLILALLSPLARIIGHQFYEMDLFTFYSEAESLPGLDEIMKRGSELEDENISAALDILQENITEELDKLVRERFDKKIVESRVIFKEKEEGLDLGKIKTLHISVKPYSEDMIEPVEKINLNNTEGGKKDFTFLEKEIAGWVSSYLSLQKEQVEVEVLKK